MSGIAMRKATDGPKTASSQPAGGKSNNGVSCGPFARNVNNAASNANWNHRGR